LAAVVDPRVDRRDLIASGIPTCRKVETAEELFVGGYVDAAIIATPPDTHFALACQGVRVGIPLLVEKPLVATLAEACELEELRRANRAILMVGFNRRWWLPLRKLGERLKQRTSPARLQLVFITQAERWGALAGTPDLLDDLATHQLDVLRFVLDQELESVAASRMGRSDIVMKVVLADGSVASCRVAHDGQPEESIQVESGSLRVQIHAKSDRMTPADGALRSVLDLGSRAWRRCTGRRSSLLRSFELELCEFIATVRDRREARPGVSDAIAVARGVAAARQSLETGGLPVAP
jgi:predicted dehydrogenase